MFQLLPTVHSDRVGLAKDNAATGLAGRSPSLPAKMLRRSKLSVLNCRTADFLPGRTLQKQSAMQPLLVCWVWCPHSIAAVNLVLVTSLTGRNSSRDVLPAAVSARSKFSIRLNFSAGISAGGICIN